MLMINLALSDALTSVGMWMVPAVYTIQDGWPQLGRSIMKYYGYLKIYYFPFVSSCFVVSTWFIVLLALQRYYICCYFHSPIMHDLSKASVI